MIESSATKPLRKTEREERLKTVQALKELIPPETYDFLQEVAEIVNNGYLKSEDDKVERSFPGTSDKVIGPKTMNRYAATERSKSLFDRTKIQIPQVDLVHSGTLGLIETVYTDGNESGRQPQQTITDATVTVIHQIKGTGISGVARALNGMRGTNTPAQRIWVNGNIPKTFEPHGYPLEVAMTESVQVVLSPEKMKQYQANLKNNSAKQ